MLFVPEELRQSPAAKALHKQYAGAKGYIAALRRDRRRLRVHLMIGGVALVALVAAVAWLMSGRYAWFSRSTHEKCTTKVLNAVASFGLL